MTKNKIDPNQTFELKSSNENLEKFAREHYFYKKDNEMYLLSKRF
jgi:hypothetical protein